MALALSWAGSANAALPAGFEAVRLVNGLTGATGIAFAPDGRAFVIEKAGRLKVVQPGSTTATTILDISGHVNDYGDRGLLGVAVDADFTSNGYVYLLYTYDVRQMTRDSSAPMVSRLVRVQVSASSAVVGGETVLIGSYVNGPCPTAQNTLDCIPSDGSSHSIGSVRAAPDGTLWVGSGDAADFNTVDPLSYRTYDEQSYAGKILHVDRNGRGLPGHPFCPTNANHDHVCTKVHAKGFRNPFRFTLRPGGGLVVGDVGWNTWEEVDLIGAGGGNYGWPCYEGNHRTPGHDASTRCQEEYKQEGTPNAALPPAWEYGRGLGSSVIGGPQYNGDQYPSGYRGSIFVGDYTGNFLKRLVLDGQGRVSRVEQFRDDWIGTALESAPNGDIVSVNYGTGAPGDGFVERYAYTTGNRAPIAQLGATPTAGPAPLAVSFTAAGSSDPDGDQLSYRWDFGDGATATGLTAQHTYPDPGTFTATLTVSDGRGRSATKTVQISAGGNAPEITIAAPTDGFRYRSGEAVQLQGSAVDAEDGALPASALHWLVRLHHADHIHPISDIDGQASASFQTRRDHDADSYYDVTLTATDSDGLTSSRTVAIYPQTTQVTVDSLPAEAPVSYGGRNGSAPWSVETSIGYDTTVTAAERFVVGGLEYVFDGWTGGGTPEPRNPRVLAFRVPDAGATLRARYLGEVAPLGAASASSVQGSGFDPARALDDDASTRWSSSAADGQWWQVDLGAERQLSRVEIDWEAAYASSYRILTSLDGASFTEAALDGATGAGTKATTFTPRLARYVRVEALARGTSWGISFFELRLFGPLEGPQEPPGEEPPGQDPPGETPRQLPPPIEPERPPPPPDGIPPGDHARPHVRGLRVLLGRRPVLSFTLGEQATVRVRVVRLARGRWRAIATRRWTQLTPGAKRLQLPRTVGKRPGRYRLTLTATDGAGNQTTAGLRFRVR